MYLTSPIVLWEIFLWSKDALGMYTVLRQVLHGGGCIITVLQTQFSSLYGCEYKNK